MAIEIEGSFDEQWGIVKSAIRQHDSAINGNGQPGLLDFASGIKAQLRLLIVMVSVGGLILAILTFLEANRQIHTGALRVANTSSLASSQQDAQLPPTYQGGK